MQKRKVYNKAWASRHNWGPQPAHPFSRAPPQAPSSSMFLFLGGKALQYVVALHLSRSTFLLHCVVLEPLQLSFCEEK